MRLVIVHVVHPYSSIDTSAAWKKLRFILSVRSDFHMTDSLLIAVHAFVSRVLMSVSVDETVLPRCSLYTYILNIYDFVRLGFWHINHCRLFNARFYPYIYIKYKICKHFVDNIFKRVELFFVYSHNLMVSSVVF